MKRVLIIQLRQLGDILLTTPVIAALRQQWPDAYIAWLSHPMGRLILPKTQGLDDIYYHQEGWSAIGDLALIRELYAQKFDYSFDFMNNPRSALLSMASGARQRFAFRSRRAMAYTHVVDKPHVSRYIVDEKFELLRAAGINATDARLLFHWDEQHLGPFKEFIVSNPGFANAPYRVAISPTHRRRARRWPLERYAAVARFLVQQWQAEVCWIWGPSEEHIVDRVIGMCDVQTHKAPKTDLRQLGGFLANTDLFIGNSNGPSHIAVAQNIATLQLHGHTLAASWSPMNERHHALQSHLWQVEPERAIESIMIEQVVERLDKMRDQVHTGANWRKSQRMIESSYQSYNR